MLSEDILNTARHLKASRDGLGELHLPAQGATALVDFLFALAEDVGQLELSGGDVCFGPSDAVIAAHELRSGGFEIEQPETGKVVELFGVPRLRGGPPPEGGAA